MGFQALNLQLGPTLVYVEGSQRQLLPLMTNAPYQVSTTTAAYATSFLHFSGSFVGLSRDHTTCLGYADLQLNQVYDMRVFQAFHLKNLKPDFGCSMGRWLKCGNHILCPGEIAVHCGLAEVSRC